MRALLAKRWIIYTAIVVLLLAGASCAAAIDYRHRMSAVEVANELVYRGVSVNDEPVVGLTKEQLEDRVCALVALAKKDMELTVVLDGAEHTYTAEDLGIAFDTDTANQTAWASNRPMTWRQKLKAAYGLWQPSPKRITVGWRFTKPELVSEIAKTLSDSANRAPVDGVFELSGSVPIIKAGIDGRMVSADDIARQINQAIRAETFSSPISISSTVVPARQVADTLSIVVIRAAHTVTLYKGATVVKQYPCAVGQRRYPTPAGDFKVRNKQINPTWVNPHSAWSLRMPERVPGGPYGLLGERALGLNIRNILLHGIPPSEFSSIGTDASHGCIRMMPADILDLFDRVEVGTPVYIR